MVAPQGAGAIPPAVLRRFFRSNYTAISQAQNGTRDGDTFIGIPNAGPVVLSGGHWQPVTPAGTARSASGTPVAPNTAALVTRHYPKQLDLDNGTFDLSHIEKELAQCATFNPPVPLFVMPITRTFNGEQPAPASLVARTTPYTTIGGGTGVQMWRWDGTPTIGVVDRMGLLYQAIGDAFDANPLFAGVGTQETATGSVTDGGFSGTTYLAGLNAESDFISLACPHGRHLAFQNFMGNSISIVNQTDLLNQYGRHVSLNGAIYGGPDLTTGADEAPPSGSGIANVSTPAAPATGGIMTRCYPNYNNYHNALNGVPRRGATFCSVQADEYVGGSAASPPADLFPNFFNMFNFATSSATYPNSGVSAGALPWTIGSLLNLDIIIWDYHQGGVRSFFNDATDIIAAHGSFGTYVPA